jgi:hypothetical protein
MVKLKKKALSAYKMDWFTNLTVRINDGPEREYELQLSENLLIMHHEDDALIRGIRILNVILPVEAGVADLWVCHNSVNVSGNVIMLVKMAMVMLVVQCSRC